jgi:uncharacterized protein YggU (UPF0235/DUF167 family)
MLDGICVRYAQLAFSLATIIMAQLYKVQVKVNKKKNIVYFQEISLFSDTQKVIIVETTEAPIDGRANKKMIELLSNFLGVHKKCIRIKNGLRSPYKTIIV